MSDELSEGLVVRIDRKQVHVEVGAETWLCALRGRLFETVDSSTRPVAVGDRVMVRRDGETGAVEAVLPRRNAVVRPVPRSPEKIQTIAANVDVIAVIASLRNPVVRETLIDRLLVVTESFGLDSILVLNKTDLCGREEIEPLQEIYQSLRYRVFPVSATFETGLIELGAALEDRIVMLLGPSGAGKSSILNALEPGLGLKVGEVNRKDHKGRHTTTFASLLSLQRLRARVVDTPGIREFGLSQIRPEDLGALFRDLKPFHASCRYPDCVHQPEPDCAVQQAVEKGAIRRARYESYLKLLAELHGEGERMARHSSF